MKNKKILIITPFFFPAIGGAETQALLIAQAFVRRNFQVQIITKQYSSTLLLKEMKNDIKIYRFQNSYQLIKLLIRNRGNQIVLWNGLFSRKRKLLLLFQSLCMLLTKILNKETIFRIPSSITAILEPSILRSIFVKSVSRWLPLTFDQKNQLFQFGIKTSIIEPPNTIIKKVLVRNKIKKEIITLVYCGRLITQKGLDIFVNSLKKIKTDQNLQILFLLSLSLEKPEESRENLKLLNNMPYPFQVRFEEDHVQRYFNDCDIGIFTSRKEGAPNVLREMMASGLTVIASNIPGCSEIVKDQSSGLLFTNEDVTDLTLKLKMAIDNQELRKKLSKNARKTINKIGSEKDIIDKLLNSVDNILES